MRAVLFVLLFTICYLLHATYVNAQSVSLGIYPPVMQIEATPPANVRAPFYVENQSQIPLNLKIEYRPFKPSDEENGQVKFLKEGSPNSLILEKVKVLDLQTGEELKTLALSPKQKKELVLFIEIPKDEPPSDYYFSLVFQTIPQNESLANSSLVSIGISSNILLSIGPKTKINGEILEFSAPFFLEKGPVPFTLRVKNNNNFYLTPRGDIIIKSVFGQSVGKVDIFPKTVLSQSVRNIGESWNESLPLGLYKAKLTLELSDSGPAITREAFFLALPLNFLIYIALATVALVYLTIKVRRSLRA